VLPSFLARNVGKHLFVVILGSFERFEEHGVAKLQLIERRQNGALLLDVVTVDAKDFDTKQLSMLTILPMVSPRSGPFSSASRPQAKKYLSRIPSLHARRTRSDGCTTYGIGDAPCRAFIREGTELGTSRRF
jgi:hypothetical protein